MENFFKQNIELLNKKDPDLAKALLKTSVNNITILENKNGEKVPQVNIDNKNFIVHSKFAPYKEAERFLNDVNIKKFDLFVVLGFGFGYHIELLLKQVKADSIILILQDNPEMLRSALENRELTNVLADNRIRILLNPTEEIIARTMQGKSSRQVSFITHRGSFQLAPQYYNNLMQLAKSYLSTKEVNIATLAKFEKTWSANISRNIGKFIKFSGVVKFYNRFSERAALVIAAGPSLNESISYIKKLQTECLIIAVDTSYHVLVKNGITPHFCLCVDPQVINARYFEGANQGDTILVADPTIHPSVFKLFKGRVLMAGMSFDMFKWVEKISGEKGKITHGGSVSTNAYDFARRLGVKEIIMVGQDLAFTNGLAHARGTYLDEQIFKRIDKFNNPQMFNRCQLAALPRIDVKGIQSSNVHTNQKMMIFLAWFEKRNDPKLINATLNGAYINNIEHKKLSDFVFPKSETDIWDKVNIIYNENKISEDNFNSQKDKLLEALTAFQNQMSELSKRLKKAVNLSEELLELIKRNSQDKGKISYIVKKLEEIDNFIEKQTNTKDMIGITVQRVIHTITEGYDVAGKDIAAEEQVAEKSLFLYKGLKEGALFNTKVLDKMFRILDR